MTIAKKVRLHLRLRCEDRERLELICATFGITRAAALRMALIAMCRQLGHGKPFAEDYLVEK